MDIEQLKTLLRVAFQADEVFLEDDDGISGYIVSAQFRGLDSIDRQWKLDEVLRSPEANLTPAELRELLAIAALTPEEYAVLSPGG